MDGTGIILNCTGARPTIMHGKEGPVEYKVGLYKTWGDGNPRHWWNKYDLWMREVSRGKHGGFG